MVCTDALMELNAASSTIMSLWYRQLKASKRWREWTCLSDWLRCKTKIQKGKRNHVLLAWNRNRNRQNCFNDCVKEENGTGYSIALVAFSEPVPLLHVFLKWKRSSKGTEAILWHGPVALHRFLSHLLLFSSCFTAVYSCSWAFHPSNCVVLGGTVNAIAP